MIDALNARTRQVLKLVVDTYVETGEPVGSKAVAQKMGMKLSPATIRAVMAELEDRGLLYAPHTSAGRLPTEGGLSVFVDGLLELDVLTAADERRIRQNISAQNTAALSGVGVYEQASTFLSGLASCAGLVFAPKAEDPVRHVEFLQLAPGRVLVILVSVGGAVENRVIDVPADISMADVRRASNYLSSRLCDRTLGEAAAQVRTELAQDRAQLDVLTARLVESGLASIAPQEAGGHLFIRGQANLLEDVTELADVARIRQLFSALEAKETMLQLLQKTMDGEGVKIFIGAENQLFSHSGCAMIVSPCVTPDRRVVGAVGVIGPARLNYGRIIPVINYTSRLIGAVQD